MEYRILGATASADPGLLDDVREDFLDHLIDAPGIEGPVLWGRRDELSAVFSVEAVEISDAIRIGLESFEKGLASIGWSQLPIQRFEVIDAAIDDEPPMVVGASDIARILGISRQRVYQLLASPDFPAPVGEPSRGKVWDRRDIERFQQDRAPGPEPGLVGRRITAR